MKKHFTIPVFIPHRACPNRCIFCDQQKISGNVNMPSAEEIRDTVERNLSTMPANAHIEIGFFGGTFTGMPAEEQSYYLETVQPYLESNRVNGLRLSTRPDFIDDSVIALLKHFRVSLIELGAQSTDDTVLSCAQRGHTAADITNAASLIKNAGFDLGLQMMVGLPGDSQAHDMTTAQSFTMMGADCVRIYPVLVIKGTELERLFNEKVYVPLTLDQAAERVAILLEYFISVNIPVIRCGLHLSEEMRAGQEVVAGPVHPSFREIAMTKIWAKKFSQLREKNGNNITISLHQRHLQSAIGYGGVNKKQLQRNFRNVTFLADNNLNGMEFHADYC